MCFALHGLHALFALCLAGAAAFAAGFCMPRGSALLQCAGNGFVLQAQIISALKPMQCAVFALRLAVPSTL